MSKILDWAKRNWLTLTLLLLVIYLYRFGNGPVPYRIGTGTTYPGAGGELANVAMKYPGEPIMDSFQGVPPSDVEQRMVVQDTSLSMQVKDVSLVMADVEKLADGAGGYMVNRNVSKPEGAASGNITIRVPVEKREEVIAAIKALGIKTVSENVTGRDVTDQYVDNLSRIESLNKVKSKMEALLEQATEVQDLMNIQNQINNVQSQMDRLVGQQKYLEQTAKLTRMVISLSTDELALPYAPDTAWRPSVVLKMAVRSMVGAMRSLANAIIWLVVYIPVLLVGLLLIWVVRMAYLKFQPKI